MIAASGMAFPAMTIPVLECRQVAKQNAAIDFVTSFACFSAVVYRREALDVRISFIVLHFCLGFSLPDRMLRWARGCAWVVWTGSESVALVETAACLETTRSYRNENGFFQVCSER